MKWHWDRFYPCASIFLATHSTHFSALVIIIIIIIITIIHHRG
jgi:hypothetical protein